MKVEKARCRRCPNEVWQPSVWSRFADNKRRRLPALTSGNWRDNWPSCKFVVGADRVNFNTIAAHNWPLVRRRSEHPAAALGKRSRPAHDGERSLSFVAGAVNEPEMEGKATPAGRLNSMTTTTTRGDRTHSERRPLRSLAAGSSPACQLAKSSGARSRAALERTSRRTNLTGTKLIFSHSCSACSVSPARQSAGKSRANKVNERTLKYANEQLQTSRGG